MQLSRLCQTRSKQEKKGGRGRGAYLLTAMLTAIRSARSLIKWPMNSAVSPPMAWQTR